MGVQLPSEPITRKEQYLAKAAGQAVEVPAEPITREEAYLNAIAKGGGGGGGTGDYNQLENLPQIGGNTLIGNKSASDLGLASEDDVAGKQDVLTAGNYISIADDGTINVTQGIGVYDVYSYVVAGRAGNNYYYVDIQKYKNGVLRSNTRYVNDQCYDKKIIDNRFSLQYSVGGDFSWHFVLLTDSNEHKEGESIVWRYNVTKDFTETFNVSQDSSTDLATKGDVSAAIAEIKLPNYSTTEQKTGQKWIDGKDRYFKTIDCGALPNNTVKSVDSGLTNVRLYKMEGVAIRESDNSVFPIPYAVTDNVQYQVSTSFNNASGIITLATGSDRSAFTEVYITLYYTKTT